MPEKPKPKGNQVREFRKAARELGADESEASFDAALKAVARHKADTQNATPRKPVPSKS